MNVIIAGAGSVGRYMAGQLQDSGHNVTLIDNDPVRRRPGSGDADTRSVSRGTSAMHARSPRFAASVPPQADVVAAVTGDDEDNLVVSLLSKQEFAVPRVLARVNNPKNEWMFNDMWGVDISVSTPHLLTASRRGGRHRRFVRASAQPRGRQGPSRRGHPGRGSPAIAQGAHRPRTAARIDRRRSAARRVMSSYRAATPSCKQGDEVLVLGHRAVSKTTFGEHWWADDVDTAPQATRCPPSNRADRGHRSPRRSPAKRVRVVRQGHSDDGTADLGPTGTRYLDLRRHRHRHRGVDRSPRDRWRHPGSQDRDRRRAGEARRPPRVHQPRLHPAAYA